MPIKTIKNIRELPSWFELEKYDEAKTLDATGWYEQLSVRRGFRNNIDRHIKDGSTLSLQTLEALEALQVTPIINVDNNFLIKVLFGGGALDELKTGNPQYSLGVHMTSVREHYLTEGNIEDEKRTYARNFFSQIFGKNWLTEPLKYKCQDWIDEPIDFVRSRRDLNV